MKLNKETGLLKEGQLNQIVRIVTKRPDGTIRIQQDFEFCPTLTEQHTSHLSDLNYLIERFKPDELAAYIQARSNQKTEIVGHDFSSEPSLTEAKNITYNLKKSFEALPEEVKINFKNHVEFLKFIDNPQNASKMLKLGLMTKKEIQNNQTPLNDNSNDEQGKNIKKESLISEPKT
ncbi:MAG: internal scaffolding protein [Arizlama microvirus]|nr:MAG: internal scaffolding protein [Arizlama microvirus]